jgi:hypothetical protein
MAIDQHWMFLGFCAALMVLLVRLIVHERVTLQASLLFFSLLTAIMAVAVFPGVTAWAARTMGFVLPSNFLFAMGIGALAVLNVATLVTLSRVELRSVVLTQELGLLREKLDRLTVDTRSGTTTPFGP